MLTNRDIEAALVRTDLAKKAVCEKSCRIENCVLPLSAGRVTELATVREARLDFEWEENWTSYAVPN